VNIILIPPYDSTTGEKIHFVNVLLASPKWKLAYSDEKSFVFLRLK